MAGAGYKLFNTGDVLTAAQVNTYLQEQVVMVFANATTRTTALTGVLAEGMMSYLQDTNSVEVYNGTSWVALASGDVTEVQAGTGISVASGTGPIPVVTNTMATAIDAKGDLVVGTGADTFARLAVGGTNGHTLQVDSSTATGLKWAATAGGGLTLLSTTTLSGASTTISSISQDYKTLYAVITGYTYTGSSDALAVKPNGVTTGIDSCSTYSIGATTGTVANANTIFFINYLGTTVNDAENSAVLIIDNYTSSTTNKPMFAYGQSLHSGGNRGTCITWGGDRQNSAISSLEFLINSGGTSFTAGTVELYGVK